MEMSTCLSCGRLFASSGPKICTSCSRRLDDIYDQARNYLRDHPEMALDAAALAKAIGVDARDIEILISMGRFERQEADPEERRRQRLLEDLQRSLGNSGDSAKSATRTTYGRDRHGR